MVSKRRKQKMKVKHTGQKAVKTCKNCGVFLNAWTEDDYCSNRCEKQDTNLKERVLNG